MLRNSFFDLFGIGRSEIGYIQAVLQLYKVGINEYILVKLLLLKRKKGKNSISEGNLTSIYSFFGMYVHIIKNMCVCKIYYYSLTFNILRVKGNLKFLKKKIEYNIWVFLLVTDTSSSSSSSSSYYYYIIIT